LIKPVGQEFKPAKNSVIGIDLKTADFDLNDGKGVDLTFNLRKDKIDGEIVGTTKKVTLADKAGDILNPVTTEFEFAQAINLTVGNTYVIEILLEGGRWGVFNSSNGYADGRAIWQGQPDQNRDLWFREGPAKKGGGGKAVPEHMPAAASCAAILLMPLIHSVSAWRKRRLGWARISR
jgi:hypothetical protein